MLSRYGASAATSTIPAAGSAGQRDRDRLAALRRIDHAHRNALALGQVGQLRALEHRDVQEHVLAAVGDGDEAETLLAVEPLHGAGEIDRRRGIRCETLRPRAATAARPRRPAI